MSLNKLYKDFKSKGFKVGKDTIFDYFSHLEDASAIFSTPIFRNSIREENRNPRKIYAVDKGFKGVYDVFVADGCSKLYENAVFLHLRRQKQEVDFYCRIDGRQLLVNVSYRLNTDCVTLTQRRETLRHAQGDKKCETFRTDQSEK